ncbi:hypothetical protein RhiirA5_395867 [Rhizophagus irregularis]|uniref:Uncharacterized protein n=1 Tax=Rhizophagus irregularis TaxID=588596 RepID=A0A2N0Q4V9_9GLOM|nr:hypothetical protein RhiirA5_395867 [Rhizophagus irregularis]
MVEKLFENGKLNSIASKKKNRRKIILENIRDPRYPYVLAFEPSVIEVRHV